MNLSNRQMSYESAKETSKGSNSMLTIFYFPFRLGFPDPRRSARSLEQCSMMILDRRNRLRSRFKLKVSLVILKFLVVIADRFV